ncbi:MAG: fibronectin type III domain-containing protein, partial [Tannerella sp.]|nr:fibronectin type III domain-containing protein [Tannerella sp.]
FYYSTGSSPSTNGTRVSTGAASGSFSRNITGLTPGTKYYYVACATNAGGTAYGEVENFTTLDEQGVTEDINRIVSKEIQKKMTDLGLPINGGGNPPNLVGTYKISPVILKKSNFSDGVSPGYQFNDVYLTFSEQNNDDLTVKVSFVQSTSIGEGSGAYVIGEGNKFSVFVELVTDHDDGTRTISADVYSGTMTSTGIQDFYNALFMIDDGGDPEDSYIENGQGRLVYDSDGLSERVTSVPRSAEGPAGRLPSMLRSK